MTHNGFSYYTFSEKWSSQAKEVVVDSFYKYTPFNNLLGWSREKVLHFYNAYWSFCFNNTSVVAVDDRSGRLVGVCLTYDEEEAMASMTPNQKLEFD